MSFDTGLEILLGTALLFAYHIAADYRRVAKGAVKLCEELELKNNNLEARLAEMQTKQEGW